LIREIKRGKHNFRVIDDRITSSWSYWDLYSDGRWEAATLKAIDNILPEGGLLFDIGAWIGPMMLWAAKNRSAEIVAVEPDPEAYRQLSINVGMNGLEHQVACLNLAVSPDGKPANLGMQVSGDSCSSLTQKGQSSIQVETTTLTQMLEYGKPDLIKMDIEGGESLILDDPDEMIYKIPMIISLHPQWYAPNTKIAETLKHWNVTNIESTNYLCLPKEF
jgi:FkbM family methyltransferase